MSTAHRHVLPPAQGYNREDGGTLSLNNINIQAELARLEYIDDEYEMTEDAEKLPPPLDGDMTVPLGSVLFISNKQDNRLLLRSDTQEKMIGGLLEVIGWFNGKTDRQAIEEYSPIGIAADDFFSTKESRMLRKQSRACGIHGLFTTYNSSPVDYRPGTLLGFRVQDAAVALTQEKSRCDETTGRMRRYQKKIERVTAASSEGTKPSKKFGAQPYEVRPEMLKRILFRKRGGAWFKQVVKEVKHARAPGRVDSWASAISDVRSSEKEQEKEVELDWKHWEKRRPMQNMLRVIERVAGSGIGKVNEKENKHEKDEGPSAASSSSSSSAGEAPEKKTENFATINIIGGEDGRAAHLGMSKEFADMMAQFALYYCDDDQILNLDTAADAERVKKCAAQGVLISTALCGMIRFAFEQGLEAAHALHKEAKCIATSPARSGENMDVYWP